MTFTTSIQNVGGWFGFATPATHTQRATAQFKL